RFSDRFERIPGPGNIPRPVVELVARPYEMLSKFGTFERQIFDRSRGGMPQPVRRWGRRRRVAPRSFGCPGKLVLSSLGVGKNVVDVVGSPDKGVGLLPQIGNGLLGHANAGPEPFSH